MTPPRPDGFEAEIARLEIRVRESAEELRALRERWHERVGAEVRAEIDEIRDEWDEVDHKWWIGVVAGLVVLFFASYAFYANLGWYADQRVLPASSDWLLERLPQVNLVPLLSWGWLGLHAWALGVSVLYYPRKLPFLLFILAIYLFVRTLFVFLSPIGAPASILDMREFDDLFASVAGTWTFQNEFIFSGHTAVPFLFFLFFETPLQKAVMLAGALTMAVAVLLTHNHYSVDVLAAWFMGYAIWALARGLFYGWVRPLFLRTRAAA
jgi:hypothetical protein